MIKTHIALAGVGMIGTAHKRVLQQSPTCELSAIVDPMPGARAIAEEAGVPLYKSLAELFEKGRPDGVILATPNQMHMEQALQCIAEGVPMLLEKPIAPTVEQGERIVKAVEKAGAKMLIGHHRAHSPIMQCAKRLIDEGRLGQIVAVMGSAVFFKPDNYFTDAPWRCQVGAGPVLINMIHEIHNMRILCGDIIAVQATSSNATRKFAVEDTVAINFRFASGALGSFMLSDTAACARSWEQTSQENKAYPTYPDEDCYVVAGTFGSLSVPTMRLKTYAKAEDRSWFKPFQMSVADMTREDPLSRQIEHFGQVVRGEAEPIVSARDGLQNLRIAEAIGEAARTGTTIDTSPTC